MRSFGKHRQGRRRGGFTLLEAALTMIIVGTGVLAAVELTAACSRQNVAASGMTSAILLANNVQEAVAHLSFSDPDGSNTFGLEETGQPVTVWDDVDDFNGRTFSPPVNANLTAVPELNRYSQEITVTRCDPQRLSLAAAGADAARVTVRIVYTRSDGTKEELHRLSWLRMRE